MRRIFTDVALIAAILAAIFGMSLWAPTLMVWSLGWR